MLTGVLSVWDYPMLDGSKRLPLMLAGISRAIIRCHPGGILSKSAASLAPPDGLTPPRETNG